MSHWDERAVAVADPAAVNIEDVYQRELELEFVLGQLIGRDKILEVGCGNGFNSSVLPVTDAFDVSEDMIRRAQIDHPGPRYFVGDVTDPWADYGRYDAVVCIRTLINLPDLADQRVAIRNMLRWLRPGGALVLVEGFSNGFRALSELRQEVGLPPLEPSPVNTYTDVADVADLLGEPIFHTGTYDVLTRVVLPLFGLANGAGPYHPLLLTIARQLGNDRTERYARVRGWSVVR
jgi:SAM-dependent methyltransferase